MEKNQFREAALLKLKKMEEEDYDQQERLIKQVISTRNYHTSVIDAVVHRVRENVEYALGILYEGKEEKKSLAEEIIARVIELQDTNENSETYGIWPYLFEEPLVKMKNPDWNWAAFIGRILIQSMIEFPEVFSEELSKRIKKSICHACKSIIRRKMGVDYTNISIMSSFVTIKAGELLENKEFYEYGICNLTKQLQFVEKNSGFTEYNSPDYGIIDIEEIGRILTYCQNPEVLVVAKRLGDLLWKDFALHYHSKTGQIAPPHTRCYENIKGNRLLSLLEIGTKGRYHLIDKEQLEVDLLWPYIILDCPELWCGYFKPCNEARVFQEKFYKGIDLTDKDELRVIIEKGISELDSYTYLEKDYCLGTFRKHDMWNQRRPLMGYFHNGEGVSCFRIRMMHDEMDYASAIMVNEQYKQYIAGGIYFVKDHGDYHYILDPIKNGTIKANQFYVQVEVSGNLDQVYINKGITGNKYEFQIGEYVIEFSLLDVIFGKEEVRCELYKTEHSVGLRIMLQDREESEIDFTKLEEAFVTYGVSVYKDGDTHQTPVYQKNVTNEGVALMMNVEGMSVKTKLISKKPTEYIKGSLNTKKMIKCGGFTYYE